MQIIDGKATAKQIRQEIAAEVETMVANGAKRPHLAAVLVGHDGGSETYVANKIKACEECGFVSSLKRFEADITEEQLLGVVKDLNEDPDVDGFIVQLPLPRLCRVTSTSSASSKPSTIEKTSTVFIR